MISMFLAQLALPNNIDFFITPNVRLFLKKVGKNMTSAVSAGNNVVPVSTNLQVNDPFAVVDGKARIIQLVQDPKVPSSTLEQILKNPQCKAKIKDQMQTLALLRHAVEADALEKVKVILKEIPEYLAVLSEETKECTWNGKKNKETILGIASQHTGENAEEIVKFLLDQPEIEKLWLKQEHNSKYAGNDHFFWAANGNLKIAAILLEDGRSRYTPYRSNDTNAFECALEQFGNDSKNDEAIAQLRCCNFYDVEVDIDNDMHYQKVNDQWKSKLKKWFANSQKIHEIICDDKVSEDNKVTQIKTLLGEGVFVNCRFYDANRKGCNFYSLLMLASEKNLPKVVQLLIENKACDILRRNYTKLFVQLVSLQATEALAILLAQIRGYPDLPYMGFVRYLSQNAEGQLLKDLVERSNKKKTPAFLTEEAKKELIQGANTPKVVKAIKHGIQFLYKLPKTIWFGIVLLFVVLLMLIFKRKLGDLAFPFRFWS